MTPAAELVVPAVAEAPDDGDDDDDADDELGWKLALAASSGDDNDGTVAHSSNVGLSGSNGRSMLIRRRAIARARRVSRKLEEGKTRRDAFDDKDSGTGNGRSAVCAYNETQAPEHQCSTSCMRNQDMNHQSLVLSERH